MGKGPMWLLQPEDISTFFCPASAFFFSFLATHTPLRCSLVTTVCCTAFFSSGADLSGEDGFSTDAGSTVVQPVGVFMQAVINFPKLVRA
jgi:hypothetical protein